MTTVDTMLMEVPRSPVVLWDLGSVPIIEIEVAGPLACPVLLMNWGVLLGKDDEVMPVIVQEGSPT